MILHDVCTVTYTEKLDKTDTTPKRSVVVEGVPCELTPLDSTVGAESGLIATRYTYFTTADLISRADAQIAEWKATYTNSRGATMVITYRGKTLSPEAGFEVHRVLGRFHHIEAIVKDFGFTGS